jgi:hypothetical protein
LLQGSIDLFFIQVAFCWSATWLGLSIAVNLLPRAIQVSVSRIENCKNCSTCLPLDQDISKSSKTQRWYLNVIVEFGIGHCWRNIFGLKIGKTWADYAIVRLDIPYVYEQPYITWTYWGRKMWTVKLLWTPYRTERQRCGISALELKLHWQGCCIMPNGEQRT